MTRNVEIGIGSVSCDFVNKVTFGLPNPLPTVSMNTRKKTKKQNAIVVERKEILCIPHARHGMLLDVITTPRHGMLLDAIRTPSIRT